VTSFFLMHGEIGEHLWQVFS